MPQNEPESGNTPPAPALVSSAEVTEGEEGKKPALEGIGGWLLYFCICITILAPSRLLQDATSSRSSLVFGLDMFMFVFSISTGVTLWMKKPAGLALVTAYFVVVILLDLLFVLFPIVSMHAVGVTEANGLQLFRIAGSLVVVVLWLMYFRRSERVRATYGRNL